MQLARDELEQRGLARAVRTHDADLPAVHLAQPMRSALAQQGGQALVAQAAAGRERLLRRLHPRLEPNEVAHFPGESPIQVLKAGRLRVTITKDSLIPACFLKLPGRAADLSFHGQSNQFPCQ